MQRSCSLATRATYGSFLLLGLTGCGPRRSTVPNPASLGSPDVAIMTVLKGDNSAFRDSVREVVRDSTRWRAIRNTLPGRNPRSEPLVNFERDMLVVAVGPPSGVGDSVVIVGITHSEQERRVRVVLYQGCHPAQLSTRPFHVVRIPRWEGRPVFKEKLIVDPKCID